MKKGRLFATIVYFIFTFGLGIVLALTLPKYFLAFSVPAEYAAHELDNGEYVKAMMVVGDCFNNVNVYESRFDEGGGIVLFETVMQYESAQSDEDDETASSALKTGMLYKTYMGYMYGVGDRYSVYSKTNETKLVVTDLDGVETSLELLDYDSDGDGKKDGLSTVEQYGFVVLDIPSVSVSSVARLEFLDKDGNSFWRSPDLSGSRLDYESEFFDNFDKIDEYNDLVLQLAAEQSEDVAEGLLKQLSSLFGSMTSAVSQNAEYTMVTDNAVYTEVMDELGSRANKRAIPIVVVYFVCIYVIADFLLGSHLIIKFFKWFLFKVCRIPHKEKKSPKKEEVFGHDYYSTVTLSLDTSEAPDFNGSVEIKYTNSDAEVKFTLLKAENYTSVQRIKAGVYVNPYIDIDRNYAPVDLPDNLEVEGYRMDKTVKIVRRKTEQSVLTATDGQSDQNTENK